MTAHSTSRLKGAARGLSAAGLLATAGLGLFACTPPHPHAKVETALKEVSSLDCPARQDELRLQSKAADGKTCAYVTDSGDQVTLQVVNLANGDAKAALTPIETSLQADLPQTSGATSDSAEDWGVQGGDKDRVDLDLPGLHVHSRGDGHADVDAGGVHVSAQDGPKGGAKGDAHVVVADGSHGGVTVDAHDGRAQIRISEKGSGVRLAYLLESDKPGPKGFKVAGYEARGPSDGPIVVASFLSKDRSSDDMRQSVRDLMAMNVGS